MIQPWSAKITETENVSSVCTSPRNPRRELSDQDPSRNHDRSPRVTAAFALVLALSGLTLSGCMTTTEYALEHRAMSSVPSDVPGSITAPDLNTSGKPLGLIRLQSPADVAESYAAAAQPMQPPLVDPRLPSSAPDASPALDASASAPRPTRQAPLLWFAPLQTAIRPHSAASARSLAIAGPIAGFPTRPRRAPATPVWAT